MQLPGSLARPRFATPLIRFLWLPLLSARVPRFVFAMLCITFLPSEIAQTQET